MIDATAAAAVFLAITAMMTSAAVHARPMSSAVGTINRITTPLAFMAVADSKPAPFVAIATTTEWAPNAVFRRTSTTAAWTLLGLSISFLVALDLFFLRHLRRVYAPSNRYPLAAE